MCGICGFVHKKRVGESVLREMNDSMAHRGPDDSGVFLYEGDYEGQAWQIGLAHRRLSILDLSPAGHQPMLSGDGNVILVYNGEIYNYKEIRAELRVGGGDVSI